MITAKHIDPTAREALGSYAVEVASAVWTPLGNAGGFSGARLWRGAAGDGQQLCLRAWPVRRTTEEKVRFIHRAQDCCRLPFIPRLWRTADGDTCVRCSEQFWEVSDWMPGRADFHVHPTDGRLDEVMRALAAIHDAWRPAEPREAPCPAVERLLGAFREWRILVQSGWKPDFQAPYPSELHDRARRAWQVLLGGALTAEYSLLEWTNRPVPVQTCMCDVWHDHILYVDDAVTGIIDFGAVKIDCVAIDLARLLGSIIPDERNRLDRALALYSAARSVPQVILDLVPVLDRAGITIGLTNWLRWLYLEKRPYSDGQQVVRRMDALLRRVEAKKPTDLLPWAV